MIVLWLLILRGISLELRNHIEVGVWRALLDGLFGISSVLLTIFFGAALANVIRGVPLQADGYFFLPLWTNWKPGLHPGILDWYTVIGGLVALVALTLHGALWIAIKTSSDLCRRAQRIVTPLWSVLLALTVVSLIATVNVRPQSLDNYFSHPITFVVACRCDCVSCRYLDLQSQAKGSERIPQLLPLSLLHARRSVLGTLSNVAARHHRARSRHHARTARSPVRTRWP